MFIILIFLKKFKCASTVCSAERSGERKQQGDISFERREKAENAAFDGHSRVSADALLSADSPKQQPEQRHESTRPAADSAEDPAFVPGFGEPRRARAKKSGLSAALTVAILVSVAIVVMAIVVIFSTVVATAATVATL